LADSFSCSSVASVLSVGNPEVSSSRSTRQPRRSLTSGSTKWRR
jgi:hypothetical protein